MAMKTFTSLFALLSCLSVYNAQAEDVTVYVYGSYPDSQRFYWYDADETNDPKPNWNASQGIYPPKFTELDGNIEKDGDIFYKKVLTPKNDGTNIKIIISDPRLDDPSQAKETPAIELNSGTEYYFYYFGDDKSYTTSPVSLTIAGSFNDWSTTSTSFTRNSMINWTYDLDAPNGEVSFKLNLPNNTYLGIGTVSLNAPQGWINSNNNDNFVLNTSTTGFTKYKLTATWNPSSNFSDNTRWSLKIEGVELNLNDNIELSSSNSYIVSSASYTRPSTGYHWGTLCLPFNITNSYNGVTFYQLNSVTETSMKFTPIEGTNIAAGTPVAFKLDEPGELNIAESNVTVVADPTTAGISNWTMKGTFQRKTLDGIYYVYNDKYYCGYNITVKPYRGWFETPAPTNGAPFRIEIEEEQSLQFVEQEDGTVVATFDLQGRKLDNARKGLVIENGKIIMIK